MSFFPFLHFFNSIAYVFLAVYIYIKNPRALVNKFCVGFLLCFGLWSFSTVFINNPYASKNTARIFSNIASFGWISFSSFFLLFILAFTKKKEILKKKWLYLLLFGIPLLLIYKQWTNCIYVDFSKEYFGWRSILGQSIWPYVFYFYYLSVMGIALYIDFNFSRKTRNSIFKKQAMIIFVATMITLILGTFTDVILPLANIYVFPDLADTFALFWAFGIAYAMVKYKFLAITPATAADNIISTMYDCLILLKMEGNIASVNKATLDLLGYKEKQLKGAAVKKIFAAGEVKKGVVEEILREENLKNKDTVFKTKDRRKIPVLFSCSVLTDDAGTKGGIVCIARDISERKKLEEEILRSKKLESIGILAGGIAHDFNNLLSVVMGNISLAQDEILPRGKAHKFLDTAEEASLKAAGLAGKFITFSAGGWLKKERVVLSNVLKEAKRLEGPGREDRNVDYDIDIPVDLMPISGDERQLVQVLQNLFLNAIEAAPEGKAAGISISLRAENTTITSNNEYLLEPGKYVKVMVEDNGMGIPEKNIENVFDPYFSTKEKNSQKGMGLGLTICYSIIKKHEGHITLESREGKGTTVTLYLPAFI